MMLLYSLASPPYVVERENGQWRFSAFSPTGWRRLRLRELANYARTRRRGFALIFRNERAIGSFLEDTDPKLSHLQGFVRTVRGFNSVRGAESWPFRAGRSAA